jgi:predicted thioesterase
VRESPIVAASLLLLFLSYLSRVLALQLLDEGAHALGVGLNADCRWVGLRVGVGD